MKSLNISLFLGICFLLLCCDSINEIEPHGSVKIKFENATGKTINNIEVLSKEIEKISNSSETDYIEFDNFPIAANKPDVYFRGEILDSLYTSRWNWCGTGKEYQYLKSGNYIVVVNLDSLNNHKVFELTFKN